MQTSHIHHGLLCIAHELNLASELYLVQCFSAGHVQQVAASVQYVHVLEKKTDV
jgi:hypothetical protein